MQVNVIFARMIRELQKEFEKNNMLGAYNACIPVAEKMLKMNIIPHPAVTSHRKCAECGFSIRDHGYIELTSQNVCPASVDCRADQAMSEALNAGEGFYRP